MEIDRRQIFLKLSLALLGLGVLIILTNSNPRHKNQLPSSRLSHELIFYDDWRFLQAVKSAENKHYQADHKIAGGIVPHHLLASDLIADFFQKLNLQKPHVVILLGPNHPEAGNFIALTSEQAWQTPSGLVEPELGVIRALEEKKLVKIDEPVLGQEHSVADLMPFLKYYLPDATVVPIILSHSMSAQEADRLAEALTAVRNDGTVMVSSVDFSHYLSAPQAARNDELTWDLIKKLDWQNILRLGNDYLDSPPSIAALLMAMQKIQVSNVKLLRHANSTDFLANQEEGRGTTSYFTIELYK